MWGVSCLKLKMTVPHAVRSRREEGLRVGRRARGMDSSGHIVCHGAISSLSHLFQSATARFSVLVGVVFALQARACGQSGCVVLPDGRGQ